jgi:hypothetical protein
MHAPRSHARGGTAIAEAMVAIEVHTSTEGCPDVEMPWSTGMASREVVEHVEHCRHPVRWGGGTAMPVAEGWSAAFMFGGTSGYKKGGYYESDGERTVHGYAFWPVPAVVLCQVLFDKLSFHLSTS